MKHPLFYCFSSVWGVKKIHRHFFHILRSIILAAVPSVAMRRTANHSWPLSPYSFDIHVLIKLIATQGRNVCHHQSRQSNWDTRVGCTLWLTAPVCSRLTRLCVRCQYYILNLFQQVISCDLVSHCPTEIYSSGFQNCGSEPSSATSGDQKRVHHDSATFIVILIIKCQPVQMRRDSRAVHHGELVCYTLSILYTVFVSSQVHFV